MVRLSWFRLWLAVLLVVLGSAVTLGGPGTVAAAACTVSTTADSGAGSLRDALGNASCTTITITATGTMTLGSELPAITGDVTIAGPGASNLTINRNAPTTTGTTVFTVAAGTSNAINQLTLSGVTVKGGYRGILLNTDSAARVTNSTFRGNGDAFYFDGGGTATVTNSTLITNSYDGLYFFQGGSATLTNTTVTQTGEGLYFYQGGSATLTNSTVSDNYHGLYFQGSGGSVTLANSTVSTNANTGLYFQSGGNATLTNSTVSGNFTNGLLFYQSGSVTLTNSTISGSNTGLSFYQGGSVSLTNSLLASGGTANCTGLISLTDGGHNLVDDASCTGLTNSTNGNIVNPSGGAGLNPAGLAANGGPTQTVALLLTSPAIDAGDQTVCASTTSLNPVNNLDQRGVSRPQGSSCDIGAFEVPYLTVTAPSPSRTVGTSNPAFTPTYQGFLFGDTASGLTTAPTCTTTATTSSPVGTYSINCSGGVSSKYRFSYVAGTLTVTPVGTLTVTAPTASRSVGTANPSFTPTITGFLPGDTAANSLTTAPTCTTTATSSSPAGTYSITCSGGVSNKYAFSYVASTLTVTLRFSDVPPTSWAYSQIDQLAARGITSGCTTTTYCPEQAVTRAQMAVFLLRANGYATPPPPTSQRFADVPPTHWAYAYIDQFAQLGITSGCDATHYCPEAPVTRAQMAIFLDRVKGQAPLSPPVASFGDVPTTFWAYGYIERFKNLNITTGCRMVNGVSSYCPDDSVTREQMAVFIIRAWP